MSSAIAIAIYVGRSGRFDSRVSNLHVNGTNNKHVLGAGVPISRCLPHSRPPMQLGLGQAERGRRIYIYSSHIYIYEREESKVKPRVQLVDSSARCTESLENASRSFKMQVSVAAGETFTMLTRA